MISFVLDLEEEELGGEVTAFFARRIVSATSPSKAAELSLAQSPC
jgi:hypothetical protein